MPWYKFDAIHGPGHQGSSVKYEWYDEELNENSLKYEWDDWVRGNDWEWPIGHPGATKVDELPDEIRQKKIKYYNHLIENAQYMLRIIEDRRK